MSTSTTRRNSTNGSAVVMYQAPPLPTTRGEAKSVMRSQLNITVEFLQKVKDHAGTMGEADALGEEAKLGQVLELLDSPSLQSFLTEAGADLATRGQGDEGTVVKLNLARETPPAAGATDVKLNDDGPEISTTKVSAFQCFIPNLVAKEMCSQMPAGERRKSFTASTASSHSIDGAVLFADMSGFTALTERLANKENGAELMCEAICDVFSTLLGTAGVRRGHR